MTRRPRHHAFGPVPAILGGLLLFLAVSGCRTTLQPGVWTSSLTSLDRDITPDSAMEAWLSVYRNALLRQMDVPVARVSEVLPRMQPESPLGNLLTDLVMEALGERADAAILNYGGIRLPQLGAGLATVGQFYELLPFDNFIAIVMLDSLGMMALAEAMVAAGGWPVSAEIRIEVGPEGVSRLLIRGQPLQGDRPYRIAMPDYVANGGDRFTFLKYRDREDTEVLLRDACMSMARQRSVQGIPLRAEVEGRIRFNLKP